MPTGAYSVRLTTDKGEIEAFLRRDPIYAAYAIGDLEPRQFRFCSWYLAEVDRRPDALALLYRQLEPPVLLTMGDLQGLAAIFDKIALPTHVYMAAQATHLPVFQAHYDFGGDRIRPMVRMAITPNAFRPARQLPEDLALRRLSSADVPAIEALLQGGGPFTPDAFNPSQVRAGVFFGVERGASLQPEQHGLLAVAGTHLVAPTRGVAAVGNIYTHPAHRGHGYGQLVTSAVTEELLNRRLLVVLNVNADNASAVHMYKKLGYRVHCSFVEGKGRRRTKNGKQDATVHDPPSNDEIGTILTDRSRHRSEEVITT